MRRLHRGNYPVLGLVALTSASVVVPFQASTKDAAPLPFKDARMKIEYNATDGDAGMQVFVDAEPWKTFEIFRPDGRRIVNFTLTGNLRQFGLTELFTESSEPPFDEMPFADFKRLFPEGNYRFEAETIEGQDMEATVPFSHDVLDAPVILQPVDGATVPADDAIIEWPPVAGAVSYQVVVTRDNPTRVLDVQLPGDDNRLTVPAEFLDAGVEYKIEVQAFDDGGSHIFTEVGFTVA
jgi:hypothetical protein